MPLKTAFGFSIPSLNGRNERINPYINQKPYRANYISMNKDAEFSASNGSNSEDSFRNEKLKRKSIYNKNNLGNNNIYSNIIDFLDNPRNLRMDELPDPKKNEIPDHLKNDASYLKNLESEKGIYSVYRNDKAINTSKNDKPINTSKNDKPINTSKNDKPIGSKKSSSGSLGSKFSPLYLARLIIQDAANRSAFGNGGGSIGGVSTRVFRNYGDGGDNNYQIDDLYTPRRRKRIVN